jgi:hypothetical protein
VRLGLKRDYTKEVERRQPSGGSVSMQQAAAESKPIKVTVEDNGLGLCGFWVGVISAVTGIIQVVIAIH